jgi:hypothetical protein
MGFYFGLCGAYFIELFAKHTISGSVASRMILLERVGDSLSLSKSRQR